MPAADLTAARIRIAAAYDPRALETAGTQLMRTVGDHFRRVESRDSKVLNWNQPAELIRDARRFLSESPLRDWCSVRRVASQELNGINVPIEAGNVHAAQV